MNCPKCTAPMEQITFNDVEIDRCTDCQGLWFDMFEEETLKKMKGAESIDIGDPDKGWAFNKIDEIICPKCDVQMIKMVDPKQHHIWFEKCSVCYGVFFDAGEFKDFKKESLLDTIKDFFTGERK